MQALLNHEQEKEEYGKQEGQVEFEDVEISLSPSATMNLWAMAILAVLVNGLLHRVVHDAEEEVCGGNDREGLCGQRDV